MVLIPCPRTADDSIAFLLRAPPQILSKVKRGKSKFYDPMSPTTLNRLVRFNDNSSLSDETAIGHDDALKNASSVPAPTR